MRRKAMWFRNKKKEGNVVFFSHIFLLILSTLVFSLGQCFRWCVCGVWVTFARLRKNNSIMLVCYLSSTIFYNVASVMKCQFVHRLYTLKKNHLCTWKKNSQYSQDTDCVPMLILSTEHLQIMRRQTIFWTPYWFMFSVDHFFMGCILRLYQPQWLFIICAPDKNMTEKSYGKCSWTAHHSHSHKRSQI